MAVVAAVTAARAAAPSGPEKVRVTATRKTAASRSGPHQNLPEVSGRVEQDDVYYRFEIKRLAPDVGENLRVSYMVVVQGALGNLRPAAVKEEEVVLSGLKPAVVETDPVTLQRLQWNRSGVGTGELREQVYGWAIRVTDEKGTILLEKYQPKDLETQYDRLLERWQKEAGGANARCDRWPESPASALPEHPLRRGR